MRNSNRSSSNSLLVLPLVCALVAMTGSCAGSHVMTARVNPVELGTHMVYASIHDVPLQDMKLAATSPAWTGPLLHASGEADVSLEEFELSMEAIDPD